MTLFELATDFDENYIARRLKLTTADGYRRNMRKHILPYLGPIDVEMIGYSNIDSLVKILEQQGLSNTTVIYVLATLRKMYSYAFKRGYCAINPLILYDFPRRDRYNYRVLAEDQVKQLLEGTSCRTDYIAYMLAVRYGLRRGEILGLKDEDVNAGRVYVMRTRAVVSGKEVVSTPKNGRFRVIKLTEGDFKIIRAYQYARRMNVDGYLLRSERGAAVSPAILDKHFRTQLRRLGLPAIRFHDLRHTYATIMLSHGVNPKIVSSVLGHSDIGITLDLYSHYSVDMQDACLAVLS